MADRRAEVSAACPISPSSSTSRRRRRSSARQPGAIATRGTSRCCRGSARATGGRRRRRLGAHRRRTVGRADVTAAVLSALVDTARATISARTSRAPPSSSVRAHASSVAPVVLTSSTSTMHRPRMFALLASRNAPRTLACRLAAGRSACEPVFRSGVAAMDDGNLQAVRQIGRLIEPAKQPTKRMKRNRHSNVGAVENLSTMVAHHRGRAAAPAIGGRRISVRGRSHAAIRRSADCIASGRQPS